jgi:hypothetical protein
VQYWIDRKQVFFLNQIVAAVRIKFRHMLCSFKITLFCTFAVIQILDNIGSLPFISLAIAMKQEYPAVSVSRKLLSRAPPPNASYLTCR